MFERFRAKAPRLLRDLLWPGDMRARLFAWTCVGIALVAASFFISERVAVLLYNYSFCIAPGTSWGKVTALLLWLLCAYLIAYASTRRGWRPFHFMRLFIALLALVASLLLINILVFNSMLDSAGGGALSEALGVPRSRLAILSHRPEAYVSYGLSTLAHTHSLKPVIYWALNPLVDVDAMRYDVGAGFYGFYPFPALVSPLVAALLVAYFAACAMLVAHAASEKRAHLAWFGVLLFGLASFSLFEVVLDGGPLSTTTGVSAALLSLYLLLRHLGGRREVKWVPALIFLPLLVLATFNALALAPWGVSVQEHFLISNLGLVATCLYEFGRGKRSKLLPVILLLLTFNLSSVRLHPQVWESREGDEVYMLLHVDTSTTDQEILERLADIQELVEPEIIARYARTTFARAEVRKAGVTSLDLARRMAGGRPAPLESTTHFHFGDPSIKYSYFIYLPLDEASLRQIHPDPIKITSLRAVGSNLVEVGFVAPEGLYGHAAYQFLMLSLSQQGARPTHCIYALQPFERSAMARTRDFIRTLIPLTRLQPVVGVAFP